MAVVASWDFVNRRIYMSAAVWHPHDIYTEYRTHRRTNESSRQYAALLRMEGNVDKGGGKATPRYVILLSGTKIVPVDGSIEPVTDIIGEIFSDDQTDFIDVSGLTVAPRINYAPPAAEIIIKLAQSQQIEYASFNGGVTIDALNGVAGTSFPTGTPSAPVNNLADAKAIASARGFDDLLVKGDLTLQSGDDVSTYKLHGDGASVNSPRTTITMVQGCITSNTNIFQAKVQGYQGGECFYERCVIGAVQNTHCQYVDCTLIGPNSLYAVDSPWLRSHTADLQECHASDGQYVVDYNGSPMSQVYTNFSGRIKLTNMTHAAAQVSLQLDAGEVEIDSSCTAGLVVLRGTGHVINKSGGTAVYSHSLLNPQNITATTNRMIEGLREHHGGTGNVFFWNPVAGDDTSDGVTPATARQTFMSIHNDLVKDGNHDVVIAMDTAGGVTAQERIAISKSHVLLRGPGRGFEVRPPVNDPGTTITVLAAGCEVAGMRVNNPGAYDSVHCHADNVYLRGVWVDLCGGNGVVLDGCSYAFLDGGYLRGVAGHGVKVNAGTNHAWIDIDGIHGAGGDGIHIEGSGISEVKITGDCDIHWCAGYGLNIVSGGTMTRIGSGVTFEDNTLGQVNDPGNNLVYEGRKHYEAEAAAVRSEITTELTRLDANVSSRATPADIAALS